MITTTCQVHGAAGFTNLLLTKEDGVIVLNPHVASCCVLRVFQRTAPGMDAPLVGYRVSDHWLDLIHLEGFAWDCFAWRKRMSSLIVSENALVQRQVEGSALEVLNQVLTWKRGS